MGPSLCSPNEETTNLSSVNDQGHNMEVTTTNRHDNSFNVAELKKDRAEFKKSVKFSTSSTKEAMTVSRARPVRISGRPNQKEKETRSLKTR